MGKGSHVELQQDRGVEGGATGAKVDQRQDNDGQLARKEKVDPEGDVVGGGVRKM